MYLVFIREGQVDNGDANPNTSNTKVNHDVNSKKENSQKVRFYCNLKRRNKVENAGTFIFYEDVAFFGSASLCLWFF